MDKETGFMGRVQKWAAKPVTDDMDMVSVILTTILVVTIVFAWTRILRLITEE